MSSEVQWIKICTDIFDDEKIQLIESMPEADTIITCWFKLLCHAGKQNNSGVFRINDHILLTDEMFSTIFRRPLNIVRTALATFEYFGMIERINGCVTITNWEKHQNIEGMERLKEQRKAINARYYQKKKEALPAADIKTSYKTSYKTDSDRTEEDIEEEKEIEKDLEIEDVKKPTRKRKPDDVRHQYGEYSNVLLSDSDLEKLKAEYPHDWEKLIDRLSSYMASKGVSYKSHLATMRNWARKDGIKSSAEEKEAVAQASARMAADMERMRKMLGNI